MSDLVRTRRLAAAPLAAALLVGAALVAAASPAGAVTVSTAAELRAAFEDPTNGEVVLANDIELDDECNEINRPPEAEVDMVLDGAGFTITQTCDERVFDLEDADFDVTFRNVTITGGVTGGDGAGINGDPLEVGDNVLTVENATLVDNFSCSDGGAIEVDDGMRLLFVRSTATGNTAVDEGGALADDYEGDGVGMTIVNSTITGNTSGDSGAVASDSGRDLNVVYSTIVENVNAEPDSIVGPITCMLGVEEDEDDPAQEVDPAGEGDPANIGIAGGALTSFGTVVALPSGLPDSPNCIVEEPGIVTSLGYNYSDDATCGFTAETDTQDGPDPQLGALASNGGPTMTRLPAATSPLVNVIPVAACGGGDGLAGFAVTTDQRGVTRPQQTGCEIGSVELEAPPPIILEPTFTG